ncbi:MAG TPA: MurT ligase domain-containing protein [Syntrophomonadaceae bacterium]|nr:MurT ligase domain-containing protein [Syntrophomonadaceae bacterium]
MKIRKIMAIMIAKMAIYLSRLAGNQGSDFPGRLARRIYPLLLSDLAENIEKDTIIVTGTNGKTTTTNMAAAILRENGSTYIHNQAGANMITGITTAFIEKTNLTGTMSFDYALLEVDEANVPLLLKEINADHMVVTNFFRDQLDRYGELDHTINLIKDAIKGTNIQLILNGDDPLQVHFEKQTGLTCHYYSFADTRYDEYDSSESREGRYCVFCGTELVYRRYHYAQLGSFTCPVCRSQNPPAEFIASNLVMNPAINLEINGLRICSPYNGFYNAYNILAAAALGHLLNISDEVIQSALAEFQPRAGRMETFIIKGKRAVLVLVKNPTGLNQSLSMLLTDQKTKNLFIALNDNAADGRDISWIWDANVEVIADADANIKKVICSGLRSGDIAVRVKYAGFRTDDIIIKTTLQDGIETAVNMDSGVSYIFSTYTALFQCRKILTKMQDRSSRTFKRQSQAQS